MGLEESVFNLTLLKTEKSVEDVSIAKAGLKSPPTAHTQMQMVEDGSLLV
jgi:hypothetical protein